MHSKKNAKPWFTGKGMSVALGLSGFGALAITILMNRHAGEAMGATSEGRALLSAGAIAVDVAGICVFGMAAGVLLRSRGFWLKVLGGAFGLIMIGSVGFSIQSIMNFVGAERMSVDEAIREKQADRKRQQARAEQAADTREKAALEAAEKQRQEQSRLAEQHLKWLQGVARKDDLTRKERKEILTGAGDVIAKLGQAPAPRTAEQVTAAPESDVLVRTEKGAEMIAEFTGLEARSVIALQMGWLAVLLILYKALAFPGAALLWPREAIFDLVPVLHQAPSPLSSALALATAPSPIAIAGPTVGAAPTATQPAAAETAAALPAKPEPEKPSAGPSKAAAAAQPESNPFLDGQPLPGSEAELRSLNFPFDARPTGPQRIKDAPKVAAKRFARVCKAYGQTGGLWADEITKLYQQFCVADHREQTSMRDVFSALQATAGVDYAKVRIMPGSDNKVARYSIKPARYSKPKPPSNDNAAAPKEEGSKVVRPPCGVADDVTPDKPVLRIVPRAPAYIAAHEQWLIAESRKPKAECFGSRSRKQRGSRVHKIGRAA